MTVATLQAATANQPIFTPPPPMQLQPSDVAIAHHWAVSMRGGEMVLDDIGQLFPGSPIHTLVAVPGNLTKTLNSHPLHTSPLNWLPRGANLRKHTLPLHPWLISRLKIDPAVKLVVTSDASMIKGIGIPSGAVHVCYCYSPPRYVWEMADEYARTSRLAGLGLSFSLGHLRKYDRGAAQRVDHFLCDSDFVRDRIERYYDKPARTIYPHVAIDNFDPHRTRTDSFLMLGELAPYKRPDVAVAACTRLNLPLTVIGEGSERARLEQMAGPTIKFLGRQPFAKVKESLETSRALIFPGVEDFGITPIEAQASGCPVIAYGRGGALETVTDPTGGLFYDDQSVDGLCQAMHRFDTMSFPAGDVAATVRWFGGDRFVREMTEFFESIGFALPLSPPLESES